MHGKNAMTESACVMMTIEDNGLTTYCDAWSKNSCNSLDSSVELVVALVSVEVDACAPALLESMPIGSGTASRAHVFSSNPPTVGIVTVPTSETALGVYGVLGGDWPSTVPFG